MKKIFSTLLLSLLTFTTNAAEIKKVFISKVIDHPAINETERGIVNYLIENNDNIRKKLELKITSAQGSPLLASQIATKFVSSNPDIVVGIGTISAQSLAKYALSGKTKLVFSSITDPVGAKLALPDNKLQNNITGVSNFIDLEPQIALFKETQPDMDTLGIIYNPSELNSYSINIKLEEICPKYGIKLIKVGAIKTADVPQAALSLVGKIDAFFISNDNTALSALPAIITIANKNNIPVYVSDIDTVSQGALLALGPDQYELGVQTGKMILSLLEGGDISKMQIEYPVKTDLVINLKAAYILGINIPKSVLKKATKAIR